MVRSLVTNADAPIELILGGLMAKAPFMDKMPTRGEEIKSRARLEKDLNEQLSWIMQPNRDQAQPSQQVAGYDVQKIKAARDKTLKQRNDIQARIDSLDSKIARAPKGTDADKADIERLMAQRDREQERLNIVNDDYQKSASALQYAELGMTAPSGLMSIDRGIQRSADDVRKDIASIDEKLKRASGKSRDTLIENRRSLEMEMATIPGGSGQQVSPGTYSGAPGRVAMSPGPMGRGIQEVPPIQQQGDSLYERAISQVQEVPGYAQEQMSASESQIADLLESIMALRQENLDLRGMPGGAQGGRAHRERGLGRR